MADGTPLTVKHLEVALGEFKRNVDGKFRDLDRKINALDLIVRDIN